MLGDLSDVDTTTLSDGDALVYEGSTNLWKPSKTFPHLILSGSQSPLASPKEGTIQYIAGELYITIPNTSEWVDPIDGKVYDLIDVDGTIWFKQNFSRDTANSWVYQDNPTKESDFGRLYTYAQVVANCPPGFHLPTLTEFIALENFLGGNVNAGYHLKSTLPEWTNPGDDLVGFFARPSSYRQNTNSTYGAGDQSYYWTSTTQPGDRIVVSYTEIGNSLTHSDYDQTTFSFSVRYVKD